MSKIVATAYVYDRPAANRIVWELLHSYNHEQVDGKPNEIPTGTGICLPVRLQFGNVVATRRGTLTAGIAPKTATSAGSIPETPAASDVGSDKVLAPDLGTKTKVSPLPAPPAAPSIALLTSRRRPSHSRASVEAGGGMLSPPSPYTYKHLFRELGTGFVGARVSAGAIELAPRLLFAYGNHGTVYNDAEQHQSALGVGGALHVGVPFDMAAFRFSPGAVMNLLYVERSFTHADFPLRGQDVKQSGLLPLLGVSARAEWTPYPSLSFMPERLGVAAEGGGDVMMTAPSEYDFGNAIVMRLNLSVTYRIF